MVAPWQTLASRPVLHDRWIDLRADDCVTETGQSVAPYYVLTYPDFVHVVAVTPDGDIILVEQYRHAAAVAVLELPGGMMDPTDPDPMHAAQRELLEETGFTATGWHLVSSLYANPATHTNRTHCVLATGCHRVTAPALEAGEDGMVMRRMKLADAIAGLRGGLLGQSMQVAGLLLASTMPEINGGGSAGGA